MNQKASKGKTRAKPKRQAREPENAGVVIYGGVKGKAQIAGRDITQGNVTIATGNIGADAQVAFGVNSEQRQTQIRSSLSVTERAEVTRLLADLQDRLVALEIPERKKLAGQKHIKQLEGELTKTTASPDPGIIKKAGEWLLKNIPALAGTLASLFLNPVIGKVVGAAGDIAVGWVKQQFGSGSSPTP